MHKKPARPCPVCAGAKSAEILHRQGFILPQGHILKKAEKYDVVSCDSCGFVYADTSIPQKTYDRYYADMSKYETGCSRVDTGRYMSQARLIKQFLPGNDQKVLDVGCGNGGLLLALKKLGHKNLAGLDPSEKCAGNIRKSGIKGFAGTIFCHNIPGKYGMVILSHVMEHVRDVSGAMDKLAGLLNENGLLYIEAPDASSYADNYVVPYYYFDTEHINHFEEASLINLGVVNGFRVVSLGKKLIQASAKTRYPAIYALYEKTGTKVSQINYAKPRVNEYIRLSAADTKARAAIDELLKKKKKIIIWGAGNYAMRLLRNSGLAKCGITAYIDNDPKKQGQKINGKLVLPPEKIRDISADTVIVICSAIYAGEIIAEIRKMRVKNRILAL
jgi:SAM-dependent methyltransferase